MAFPTNPSPGDSYTDGYGTVWVYAGAVNGWYRQSVSTPNDTSYTAAISGPAGSNTQVQFNDNGELAGDSGLTYNKTTDALSGGAFIPTGSAVPTNGVYLPSANNVAISTNGTGRLFVDASGNVGVGTSPSYPFHAVETIAVTSAASFSTLFGQGTRADLVLKATSSANDQQRQIIRSISDSLIFGTENSAVTVFTEKMRLDSSGRLGLGTSSPGANLDLVDGNTFSGIRVANLAADATTKVGHFTGRHYINAEESVLGLRITSDSSSNSVILGGGSGVLNAATNIQFYTAAGSTTTVGTQRMIIDSLGHVGVGTTTPAHRLHVEGGSLCVNGFADAANNYITLRSGFAPDVSGGNGIKAVNHTGGSDDGLGLYGHDGLSLFTVQTERARIDSSGRLLVGTSTSAGSKQLIFQNSAEDALTIRVQSDSYLYNWINLDRQLGGGIAVVSGASIGSISFRGWDGSNAIPAASISANVDGTPGANDMPGRLVFSTTADGASSPTEQLRITSDRYVRLASGSGGIQFNGDTAAANALDDYEEGTWTPVHSDAANTTATLTGLYRKIGSIVYVRVTASGTGTLKVGSVSGLPFINIATVVGTGGKVSHSTSATSDTSVIGYQANAAVINLNLSADVSVSAGASWVASITCVVF